MPQKPVAEGVVCSGERRATPSSGGLMKKLVIILTLLTSSAHANDMWTEIDSTNSYRAWITEADNLRRVYGFSDLWYDFQESSEDNVDNGYQQIYYEMHMESHRNWYAIMLYIPFDVVLTFDSSSRIVAITDDKEIESARIVFSLGFGDSGKEQHTIFEANEEEIQISPMKNSPGHYDFEWLLSKNNYYIIGYIRFDEEVRALNWHIKHVLSNRGGDR